jgi:hypothetical protein
MLIGRMIDDQVHEDAEALLLGLVDELDEVAARSVPRMHAIVIRHIIAVVVVWRWVKCRKPDRVDAEEL